MVYQQK
jgi:hypothetical protein